MKSGKTKQPPKINYPSTCWGRCADDFPLIQQIGATISQNQRFLICGFCLTLTCFYLLMDGILYSTLQATPDLVNKRKSDVGHWSPFSPLSVKLLMSDPTTHYIITPLSEYIDETTKFSKIFYFITPNMITFTHLVIAIVSSKFIVSESLQSRRIGVLLYEVRSFLDAFDGTVYRSRASKDTYQSDHNNFGFWFDSVCDTIAGIVLMFAIFFCFLWKCEPGTDYSSLQMTADDINESQLDLKTERPVKRKQEYSCQLKFFRCLCFGVQIGLSSAMWDQLTLHFEKVFMVKFEDAEVARLQSVALHSAVTWGIFWLWRYLCGQGLQQFLLLSIFIDKCWEFLRLMQYLGFVVLAVLISFSFYHYSQIQQSLQGKT